MEIKAAIIPSDLGEDTGYGKVASRLAQALEWAGVEIASLYDTDWDVRVPICGPRGWLVGQQGRQLDILWHTMFEAHPLPPEWVQILNRVGGCWVPAQWNVNIFRESGVRVPLYVGGYGVDTGVFRPYDLPREDGPYTYLWTGSGIGNGQFGDRKGAELVIAAFRKLNLSDTRLVLKASSRSAVQRINGDDRITVITRSLPEREYVGLHSECDCYVYASHGEGFGLQPLEAMACGLPVICPAYSGMADFIHDGVAIQLPNCGEERATLFERIYDYAPLYWARYRVNDLCERMEWCYRHREEAKAIGIAGMSYVREWWTWERAGRRGREIIEKHLIGV
jgi:glycosyltransferase involved in cell wall biosynthesis